MLAFCLAVECVVGVVVEFLVIFKGNGGGGGGSLGAVENEISSSSSSSEDPNLSTLLISWDMYVANYNDTYHHFWLAIFGSQLGHYLLRGTWCAPAEHKESKKVLETRVKI